MWVKFNGTTRFSAETLIATGAGGGTSPGIWIYTQSTSTILFDFCDGTTSRLQGTYSANKVIYDNNWHLLTFVINRTGNMTLYTDGVKSITGGLNITSQRGSVNDGTPKFGKYANGSGSNFQFDGTMDDIRFYNRVLTQNEITSLYQSVIQNSTHTYTTPGSYSVSLTEWNVYNTTDTELSTDYITVLNLTPAVSFTCTKKFVRTPNSVTCTDTSTNTPTSWEWYWGDGTANITATSSPTHQYLKRGQWNVILNATNDGGSNTSTSIPIKITGYENY